MRRIRKLSIHLTCDIIYEFIIKNKYIKSEFSGLKVASQIPPLKNMTQKTLSLWIRATRPQFFTIIILPILLGTAIAWHSHGVFLTFYFGLALLAGILTHASSNVLNDYFDKHADALNETPLSPFAGGSRMIQKKILTPSETYRYGWVLLIGAISIGLFLVWTRGLPLLWIGLIGILSGYFYSAPPLSLQSKGWGEIIVGLDFGVLAVLGAYYVQTQQFTLAVIFASLPLAFLVAAILYINGFPDYAADKQAGKNTLIVRLDKEHARPIYGLLIGFSMLSIVMGVLYQFLPLLSLVSLLAFPLGIMAIKTLYAHYNDTPTMLIPAIKNTIMLHTIVSGVLIIAFLG